MTFLHIHTLLALGSSRQPSILKRYDIQVLLLTFIIYQVYKDFFYRVFF